MTASLSKNLFKNIAKEIDFSFNSINNVSKVSWNDSAPWFREVNDGFCWIAYCHNKYLN